MDVMLLNECRNADGISRGSSAKSSSMHKSMSVGESAVPIRRESWATVISFGDGIVRILPVLCGFQWMRYFGWRLTGCSQPLGRHYMPIDVAVKHHAVGPLVLNYTSRMRTVAFPAGAARPQSTESCQSGVQQKQFIAVGIRLIAVTIY